MFWSGDLDIKWLNPEPISENQVCNSIKQKKEVNNLTSL